MTEEQFWTIIDQVKISPSGDTTRACATLARQLSGLSDEDLIQFHDFMWHLKHRAWSRRLWLAVDFLLGMRASDDSFDYSINRLIFLGRDTFNRAITDPDCLAELPKFEEAESLAYPANDVWMERHPGTLMPLTQRPLELEDDPKTPEEGYELNERLPELYPRLFAKYGLPQPVDLKNVLPEWELRRFGMIDD